MLPDDSKITTVILLRGALFFALVDSIFVPVLLCRIKPTLFRQIKWVQVIIAGIIWFGIWDWAIDNFWKTVYIHVFPAWGQYLIPPFFGLLMAIIALGLWSLATRLTQHPVLGYALWGGLWGVCTHIWAVYRGIVTQPPMLQGASPVAAVVIAFFEYVFYWCIVLSLSALAHRGWTAMRVRTD